MNPEALDTITRVLAEHDIARCFWHCRGGTAFGSKADHRGHQADVVLAALRTGGYELAALPSPDARGWWVVDEDDFVVRSTTLMRERDGEWVQGVQVDWGSLELNLSNKDARSFAAALLAAAAVAEQTGEQS